MSVKICKTRCAYTITKRGDIRLGKRKARNIRAWGASCRIRTNDPEITNHVLWPTELKRRVGKLLASRRYDLLPLLRSRPGGFEGSWPCKTCPFCGCKGNKKRMKGIDVVREFCIF